MRCDPRLHRRAHRWSYDGNVVTQPHPPPVSELRKCLAGCEQWLRRGGFLRRSSRQAFPWNINDRKVNASQQASAVRQVGTWLVDTLAVLDGTVARREAEASQRLPSKKRPNPSEVASLAAGSHEADLVESIEQLIEAAKRLLPAINLAQQRALIRPKAGKRAAALIGKAFENWIRVGLALGSAIDGRPTRGLAALRPPKSLSDWRRCRQAFEAVLNAAGHSDQEIAEILMLPGGPEGVLQRRYRIRTGTRHRVNSQRGRP